MTIGPYRISERLGTGGMGEVFKAYDDRLDRWVAIKRIRPGKEDTDDNRERFQREARATAQLNHPAIVHVYDIFRDGDSDCIVMEYVEGDSLHSMTSAAPLDPVVAAGLALEIAEGLAAAHAKGILHRDLKTENIIVTPEGHAKILDFGLAKPLLSNEIDASLTGKGQLVGTSRAMSPEYVGGEEVDHRSDLFALGVLLYETVAGHSPFKAQNTLATLKQVIIHQQPPSREMNPDVPAELSDLIDRLLEKSPDDRPQSAAEVAQELARITGQPSSGTISRSGAAVTYPSSSVDDWSISRIFVDRRLRRYWVAIAAVIAVALLGAYFLGIRTRQGTLPGLDTEKEIRIVLGDFENLTNEARLDVSLNRAFRMGMEQSRHVRVLDEGKVRDALIRMQRNPDAVIDRDLALEICQRETAEALVIGSIVKVGTAYQLNARIIGPDSNETLYSSTPVVAENQDQILGAISRVTQDIRSNLGESVTAIEANSRPLEKVTTPNLDALKAYSLGIAKSFDSREEGIALLERAVQLDPSFAMAHAKLGMLYLSFNKVDKCSQHLEEALRSPARLTQREKLYVEGWTANRKGGTEEMVQAWSLMSTLYPENPSGHHNLGMVLWLFRNEFAAAADAFAKAKESSGYEWSSRQEGYCHLALNDIQGAMEKFGATGQLIDGKVDALIYDERYADALEIINSQPLALRLQVPYYTDRGNFEKVAEITEQIIKLSDDQDVGIGSPLLDHLARIVALEQLGEESAFHQAMTSGIELARETLEAEGPGNPITTPIAHIAGLGKISARNGDIEQAEDLLRLIRGPAEASGIELWHSYVKMLQGEIFLARGDDSLALAKLEDALADLDSFQVRESIAYAASARGDADRAMKEYRWLSGQRGRAFAECMEICYLQTDNLVRWSYSLFHLARLLEESGRPEEALEYYRRFVDRWEAAEDLPSWQEAKRRLVELQGQQASSP